MTTMASDINPLVDLMVLEGNYRSMVERDELLAGAKARGVVITDRMLTTFITERVFPRSARMTSTGKGKWPRICIDLLAYIGVLRQSGTSFEAIVELVPLWCYVEKCRKTGSIDLNDFEEVARQQITRISAAFWVPWLLGGLLTGPEVISVRRGLKPVSGSIPVTVSTVVGSEVKELGTFYLAIDDLDGSATVHLMGHY
jgi:hypothetical protein